MIFLRIHLFVHCLFCYLQVLEIISYLGENLLFNFICLCEGFLGHSLWIKPARMNREQQENQVFLALCAHVSDVHLKVLDSKEKSHIFYDSTFIRYSGVEKHVRLHEHLIFAVLQVHKSPSQGVLEGAIARFGTLRRLELDAPVEARGLKSMIMTVGRTARWQS